MADQPNREIALVLKKIDQLLGRGDIAGAERAALELRSRHPLDPFVAYQLGCVRRAQGRVAEAAQAWRQAVAAKPTWAHPVVALAWAADVLGNRQDCVRYSEMAHRLAPHDAQTRLNYALALFRFGRDADALAIAEQLIAVSASMAQARVLRMEILRKMQRWADTDGDARWLLEHVPGSVDAIVQLCHNSRHHGDFSAADGMDRRLLAAVADGKPGISPFYIARAADDPAILAACARLSGATRRKLPPAKPARAPGGRVLTVAYLSPDLRRHPVGQMMMDVLAAHDRQRVKVVTASLLPDDGSAEAARLRGSSDLHLDLAQIDIAESVERILRAEVDVLVDLAGSTEYSRPDILAQRPAAVQVMWLGCPVTTGAQWYDAWLLDDFVAPAGSEQHASEPIVRLPRCYHPIATGGGVTADPGWTRALGGLPEDVPVLAALHAVMKLNGEMVDAWIRIAASHPRAVLWLALTDPRGRESLRRRAADLGLDPARVVFADREPDRARYLARYRLADLFLDTYPYGGHSTAGEALALGCPVLTRCGRSIPSRVAGSMLRQVGLPELATGDLASYEALGRALLADAARLAELRARCARIAATLAADRDRSLVRALEDAYSALHAAACGRAASG